MQNELSNHEVALRSRQVLDLGRRQARLIFLAGIVGVVLLVVASLVGNRPETIPYAAPIRQRAHHLAISGKRRGLTEKRYNF